MGGGLAACSQLQVNAGRSDNRFAKWRLTAGVAIVTIVLRLGGSIGRSLIHVEDYTFRNW
jgi:hypothetical protein